jgi:hypothetical protein
MFKKNIISQEKNLFESEFSEIIKSEKKNSIDMNKEDNINKTIKNPTADRKQKNNFNKSLDNKNEFLFKKDNKMSKEELKENKEDVKIANDNFSDFFKKFIEILRDNPRSVNISNNNKNIFQNIIKSYGDLSEYMKIISDNIFEKLSFKEKLESIEKEINKLSINGIENNFLTKKLN